jgi:hypothetical protein
MLTNAHIKEVFDRDLFQNSFLICSCDQLNESSGKRNPCLHDVNKGGGYQKV